jgi:Histidine kinase/Y_Y_Y domain/Two component regulator propeller
MRFICTVFLLLGFFHLSLAQNAADKHYPEEFRLVNWNSKQGLYYGKVTCFLKDINGFLWVGTNGGLNRFDGSLFKNYLNPSVGNHTTIGVYILSLTEDSLHNIWVGTDKGISRYDIKADSFTHFLPGNVFDQPIVPFWATANLVYCVESDTLITAYNIISLQKKRICQIPNRWYAWYEDAFSVLEPKSNCIWMLSSNWDGALLRVSLSDGKQQVYNCPSFTQDPNVKHYSESMCYDKKRNCLWLNDTQGLIQFTLADQQFHYIDCLKNIINRAAGISMDLANRVWIGTGDKGLIVYDPQTGSVERPFENDAGLNRKANEFNYRIYCDQDGMVWIGYWISIDKGINQLLPVLKSFRRYVDTIMWGSIEKSIDGRIWIIAGPDLKILNPATDSFQVIKTKDISGIGSNTSINYLGRGRSAQKAWVSGGQTGELFEMDILSKRCRPIPIMDRENHRVINLSGIKINRGQDDLFIGALPNQKYGIFFLNKDSSVVHQMPTVINGDFAGWESDGDRMVFLRRHGEDSNLTYTLVKGNLERTLNPLDSFDWINIYSDPSDHSWWVGTFMELIHYDNHFSVIHRYTHRDGVPLVNVFGIHADKMGNIWFNTESSIARLNPKTGQIRTLSAPDGFQEQTYTYSSLATDDDGDLYFLGYYGLDRVKPDKVKDDYPPSLVYLKSLEINQAPVSIPAGASVEQDELNLKYFQNKISIETGIIDYYSKGLSKIRYKLDGVNKDWQYGPANYTIRYEELPPGKYTLFMQADNAGHEFTGPVRSLLINISPAFWDTWWFRIIGGLLLIGGIYTGIRYRLNQKFRLKLESSEKEKQLADMRQSTAELKQQTTELEMQALRAQMNPHFIFNSLNSINRFILQNNRLQAAEYLTKFSRLIRLILLNSQTALVNLESEIESIKLYLSLEALRFDDHFEYKLSVDPEMDTSVLKVPSMIIQPYIENAVWHGLMHKKEKGQLDIELTQEDDHLYFKIADNGIGRRQAAALTSKSATLHKSMGLGITARRIAMLESGKNQGSSVIINDLVNEDGSAAGTEVVIKIPVIL